MSVSSGEASGIVVVDVPEQSRYEARLPGASELAAAHYRREADAVVFTHTIVPEEMEGHGIGSALARYALDDARRQGLAVLPQCPFIAGYIRRHPEYLDLVPEDARARFGL